MAAVYLLTANAQLWRKTVRYVYRNYIDFRQIRLSDCTIREYTLFCAAKDLYLGTDKLIVSDLADIELISPRIFDVICNAMAIRRFGIGAIQYKEVLSDKD